MPVGFSKKGPYVAKVSPVDGATDRGIGTLIRVTFGTPMRAASISSATITLRVSGGSLVTCAVTYDPGKYQAILDPASDLANGESYTVRVFAGADGVKDKDGGALAAAYVWSFSTVDISTTGNTFVGYGSATTGGDGGVVYQVTSWASFQTALAATGARIIKFVPTAGVIDGLGQTVNIDNGDLTVDGTGWARSFRRAGIRIRASNVIFTQLRLRPGDQVASPDDVDGLTINSTDVDGIDHIVIDHCSILWGPDVTLGILNQVSDVTVQHCILGAGLKQSKHSEAHAPDFHSYGPNVTTIGSQDPDVLSTKRITFFQCYIPHNYTGRNIRGLWSDPIEYVECVVYNWHSKLGHVDPVGGNYVRNMFKKGPGTPASNEVVHSNPKDGATAHANSVYWPVSGANANVAIGFTQELNLDNGVERATRYGTGGATASPVTAASEALANQVVAAAGPTVVDAVDKILKDDWTNGTGDYWNGAGFPAPNPYWP